MLGTLFSFRGRINRLQFFLGLLGLIAAIVVPLVIAVVIGGSHPTAGAGGRRAGDCRGHPLGGSRARLDRPVAPGAAFPGYWLERRWT